MRPRYIVPGVTYLITRSTSEQRFFLRPSRQVNNAIRYCIAIAAERSGVAIHAICILSDHYHIILTDLLGLLPLFAEELNKLLARCLNRHYGRKENFWAGSVPTNYVRLEDDDAIIRKTAYLVANPVEARLVQFSREWPGVLLWRPGCYRAKRPRFFFRQDGPLPAKASVVLTPPPIEATSEDDAVAQLKTAVRERETMLRKQHRAEGRKYLGAGAVKSQKWWESASTAGRRRKPGDITPRLATRSRSLRIRALEVLKTFADDYRRAFLAWRAGDRGVVFPFGTYKMRITHRALCAAGP